MGAPTEACTGTEACAAAGANMGGGDISLSAEAYDGTGGNASAMVATSTGATPMAWSSMAAADDGTVSGGNDQASSAGSLSAER